MPRKKQTKKIDEAEIISRYMEYLPAHDKDELTSLDFCTECSLTEEEFNGYFESIRDLEKTIWHKVLTAAISTIKSDGQFQEFSDKDKMLSLYYTFFENLTLNQDYFLQNLNYRNSVFDKFRLFQLIKRTQNEFVKDIFASTDNPIGQIKVLPMEKIRLNGLQEGFWALTLFLIDFWKKDSSENLEKNRCCN